MRHDISHEGVVKNVVFNSCLEAWVVHMLTNSIQCFFLPILQITFFIFFFLFFTCLPLDCLVMLRLTKCTTTMFRLHVCFWRFWDVRSRTLWQSHLTRLRTIFWIIWLVQLPKFFQTSLSYFNLGFITCCLNKNTLLIILVYFFPNYKSLSITFYLNLHKHKYYNQNLPCRSGHQQLVHKVWESASIFLPAASRWRCSSAQEL